jgi:NADPH-ferrihemoprotein reductase
VAIFWGSQSGQSQRLAGMLARNCGARYGINAMSADLDDYDHKHFTNFSIAKIAVFIVATYGEGDPTDNANTFLEYLESQPEGTARDLTNLQYLVFGLGNSTYRLYNRFVDVVDKRLQSRGARRLWAVGKADAAADATATDDAFEEWQAEALQILGQTLGRDERPMIYEPSLDVSPSGHIIDAGDVYLGEPNAEHLKGTPNRYVNHQNPYAAPIAVSKELFTSTERRVLHMEFDISEAPSLKYRCGDHLAVWPMNPDGEVDRLAKILGWDDHTRREIIHITSRDSSNKVPIPTPTTRETALRYYLEISGPISREMARLLEEFAPSPRAKQRLQDMRENWCNGGKKVASEYLSIGKLMEFAEPDLPWSAIPLSLLVESVARVRPRYYSISSSPTVAARKPAITAAVTGPMALAAGPSVERFHGLTTNYLLAHQRRCHHEEGDSEGPRYDLDGPRSKLADGKVLLHIRASAFKLPSAPSKPIIMVGTGTGIAPFRGFLQERTKLFAAGKEVGNMLLFFGCRFDEDFLYADELAHFQKTKAPVHLIPAFSRKGHKKIYVQHRLEENKQEVTRLLTEQEAYFYICGSAPMALDVRKELVNLLRSCKKWTEDEAEQYLRGLKASKRFQEDVWSS